MVLMSEFADFFQVPDIAWQATMPPTRHAVPARYAGDLTVGAELTIGRPGHYFIDDQRLARSSREEITLPGETESREALGVAAPFAFELAKAFPKAGLTMQWWPLDYTWVYRDALNPGQDASDATADPDSTWLDNTRRGVSTWLDNIRPGIDSPPTRTARPARELPAVTGMKLRLQHEPGSWSWWIAVSEPVDVDGEFVVRVMTPEHYWLTQVMYESDQHSRPVPLHRLFGYL
jgi:hypothetical protein